MPPTVVTAVGMASSLGLSSADACAAARAGLVRLSEIDTFTYALDPDISREGLDGVPLLVGHQVPIVAAGRVGISKLLALSRPALNELLRSAELTTERLNRTALFVNVSDAYFQGNFGVAAEDSDAEELPSQTELWEKAAAQLPGRLCADFAMQIDARHQFVQRGGHTGIAELLQSAMQLIEVGQVDRCIVGAVESCIEPQAIAAYSAAGVLKCEANPTGFIPGEAAGFALIEPMRGHPSTPGAFIIGGVGQASDAPFLKSSKPPHGLALATCIGEALSASGRNDVPGVVITDLNGTESRASDWGHALVRLRASLGDLPFDTWLPAQSFGETGAATGCLALCLAYHATERRYAPAGGMLVTLSAEDGRRAALRLDSIT